MNAITILVGIGAFGAGMFLAAINVKTDGSSAGCEAVPGLIGAALFLAAGSALFGMLFLAQC